MLLTTTTGYQTREFARAAEELGLEVVLGSDRCHVLDDPWRDGALALKFKSPEEAAANVLRYAQAKPLAAVVALGDAAVPTAARACRALGLPGHPPEAADACGDKFVSRQRLREAGLNVPRFMRVALGTPAREIVSSVAQAVGFPCVLKPLALSASRGVIRASDADEFAAAFERLRTLLRSPEVRAMRRAASDFMQVESYVEGAEFAVEGLVERGRVRVLALFDKPDPLEGPYFEETIYVTPSRLPASDQDRIVRTVARAAQALGLEHGPLHAEARLNARGVWMLEVAARSIGGLCARALRFEAPGAARGISLEELGIRLALGEDLTRIRRERAAAGVMMIPVAEAGILREVQGLEAARATPGVEEVVLTARPGQRLVPWPEGASYPGFLFARGATPEGVEQALRRAHAELRFVVSPALAVL